MSHGIAAIPIVERHFKVRGFKPVIAETFHPDKGWVKSPWAKRVSESHLRSLRAAGITKVGLAMDDRVADFSVAELLASAAGRRSDAPADPPKKPRYCRRESCADFYGGYDRIPHMVGECS